MITFEFLTTQLDKSIKWIKDLEDRVTALEIQPKDIEKVDAVSTVEIKETKKQVKK